MSQDAFDDVLQRARQAGWTLDTLQFSKDGSVLQVTPATNTARLLPRTPNEEVREFPLSAYDFATVEAPREFPVAPGESVHSFCERHGIDASDPECVQAFWSKFDLDASLDGALLYQQEKENEEYKAFVDDEAEFEAYQAFLQEEGEDDGPVEEDMFLEEANLDFEAGSFGWSKIPNAGQDLVMYVKGELSLAITMSANLVGVYRNGQQIFCQTVNMAQTKDAFAHPLQWANQTQPAPEPEPLPSSVLNTQLRASSREYMPVHGWHTDGRHTDGRHTHGQRTHGRHTNGQHTNGQHTHGQHTNGQHTNGKGSQQKNTCRYGDLCKVPNCKRWHPGD
uniref:Uncharacterized protein n=1 Tax=Pinguiococcus pyrenoidosus TaxID=172671 RepID=A0A7R9YEN5_9STRA|mmetsp:Transcript_7383/g.28023  ORF Transcript_7383/g.28023 Transcript_7383/m.28023 type:complete len:336 (+) Transcript_7383:101-1108(+)